MAKDYPKYSIIVPARNGFRYLPTCISSITEQKYNDYELIVSDDHSTDGSKAYLATLSHPKVTVIEPPESLSMTEHWEWALSHARGDWLIFVGQDDGLQPYFFQLADKLTGLADQKGLRAIASERAYFFWKGCEFAYGDVAVSYSSKNKVEVLNSKLESIKALLDYQSYFELPQMYTTSLFRRGLLDEAKHKQGGKVFQCHPQDANLAAIACSLEGHYLKSHIPLGWVGTSPKSAGMAVSFGSSNDGGKGQSELDQLKIEYEKKIVRSELQYHPLAGDFAFGDGSIYFWQALLKTESLRSSTSNRFFKSQSFKVVMFGVVLANLRKSARLAAKSLMFGEILKRNSCNPVLVSIVSWAISIGAFLWRAPFIFIRIYRRFVRLVSSRQILFRVNWAEDSTIDMHKASSRIMRLVGEKKWLEMP